MNARKRIAATLAVPATAATLSLTTAGTASALVDLDVDVTLVVGDNEVRAGGNAAV